MTGILDFLKHPVDNTEAAFSAKYNELKRAAADMAAKYKKLQSMKVPAKYSAKKNALLASGKKIVTTFQSIFGKIDQTNKGLGFIPLVAGVTLVSLGAALTLISKWVLEYGAFSKEVSVFNTSVAKGATPTQAAKVAKAVSDSHRETEAAKAPLSTAIKNTTEVVKNYAPLIGIGIIIYVFKDKIFPKRGHK